MHILSLATTSNPSDEIHLLCGSSVLSAAQYISNLRTTKSLMHLVYATTEFARTKNKRIQCRIGPPSFRSPTHVYRCCTCATFLYYSHSRTHNVCVHCEFRRVRSVLSVYCFCAYIIRYPYSVSIPFPHVSAFSPPPSPARHPTCSYSGKVVVQHLPTCS